MNPFNRRTRLPATLALRRSLIPMLAISAFISLPLGPGAVARTQPWARPAKSQGPLDNFSIGLPESSPTTGLVAQNGTAYLAYTSPNAHSFSSAYVCVLPRGARKCSVTTLLAPLDSKTSVSEQPDSMVWGSGGTVDVIVTTSNDANTHDKTKLGQDADTIEYVLNSKGALAGPGVRIGTLASEGNAITYKGQLLWVTGSSDGGTGGIQVQESPADGSGTAFTNITAPTRIDLSGTAAKTEFYFYGGGVVALSNGDLLIAWDDNTNTYAVEVDPSNNFKVVGSSEFKNEVVEFEPSWPQGGLATGRTGTFILLRQQATFSGKVTIRKYKSQGEFGPAMPVPSPADTDSDYGDFRLLEQGDGALDVLFVQDETLLVERSFDGGAKWTSTTYSSETPIETENVAPALTSFGAGVVFEASGGTYNNHILPKVQPVLVHQSISLSLSPNPVVVNKRANARGKVAYPDAGQTVSLEKYKGGSWKVAKTTHERASGKFHFSLYTGSKGSYTYRVVSAPVAGWFFGDASATHSLTVSKPKKK